jgi:hypothetical protein
VSAIAAVLLFFMANALWGFEQPAPDASGPTVVEFYENASGRIIGGALLSLVSIALLAVFASAFRTVLVELEGDELAANLALCGTVMGLAAGIGAETVNMAAALRAGDDQLTQGLALALFDVSYVLGSYAAAVGFGLLALAIGHAALRSGTLLPHWAAMVAVAIGATMITPVAAYVIGELAVVPCFLLLLGLGVSLLRGSAATPSSAR